MTFISLFWSTDPQNDTCQASAFLLGASCEVQGEGEIPKANSSKIREGSYATEGTHD